MSRGTLLAATGTWCAFVVAAIVNGAAREAVLRPTVGRAADPLSVFTLMAVILAGTRLFVRRLAPRRPHGELIAVGALWTAATVAFEFLFGHYAAGTPWRTLVANYDLRHGRLWPLVLVETLLAPVWLGGRARDVAIRARDRLAPAPRLGAQ